MTDPTKPLDPAPAPADASKNVLQSVTVWGLIAGLFPLITQAQTWHAMTPDARTTFLTAAFAWVVTLFGRLRQGDLKILPSKS